MSESKTPADKDQKPADASEAELPEKKEDMDAVRERMKARGFIIDKELPDGGGMGFVGGASRSMSRRKRSLAPRARSPMVSMPAIESSSDTTNIVHPSLAGSSDRPARVALACASYRLQQRRRKQASTCGTRLMISPAKPPA